MVDVQGLIRSIHEVLILASLGRGRKHGYQIAMDVETESGGVFGFQHGTLYPILHRLERDRLIQGEWAEGGGRRRKTYRVTAAGRAHLARESAMCREAFEGLKRVLGEAGDAPVQ